MCVLETVSDNSFSYLYLEYFQRAWATDLDVAPFSPIRILQIMGTCIKYAHKYMNMFASMYIYYIYNFIIFYLNILIDISETKFVLTQNLPAIYFWFLSAFAFQQILSPSSSAFVCSFCPQKDHHFPFPTLPPQNWQ